MSTITLGKHKLQLNDIADIVYKNANIKLFSPALKRAEKSFRYLLKEGKRKTIYGFNTGFGPMAHITIPEDKQRELQYNLIRSHAVGRGDSLPPDIVKTILIVRLNSLLRGYSGVPQKLLKILAACIEKDILPVIPEHGSVGASGDLVQLAHVALALIGKGEVFFRGRRMSAARAFHSARLSPVKVQSREGLAVMNGTAAMTGIAAINILQAEEIMERSVFNSACLYELTRAYDDSLSAALHAVRPHAGQKIIAARIRELLKGSKNIQKRFQTGLSENHLQEAYSIRCSPQILGPLYDALQNAKSVVEIEMNSVTDNPVIIPGKPIYHGGNFHGDYVALEMDKLKIAMAKLSLLSERRVNFLLNDSINGFLPPFLNTGTLGLELGLQGLQFIATSTAAENQTLSMPASIHSIPSNKDNQDVVSMGVSAALFAKKVIENTRIIVDIEKQAIEKALEIIKSKSA